ncbi:hypothetical protein ACQF4J_21745 [Streptomyces sp. C1-1]|uniref:hypothetical protein n=1 Tax=Streptomyces sp. C1-1 TaxID=3231173 RepID=UPI003D02A2D0
MTHPRHSGRIRPVASSILQSLRPAPNVRRRAASLMLDVGPPDFPYVSIEITSTDAAISLEEEHELHNRRSRRYRDMPYGFRDRLLAGGVKRTTCWYTNDYEAAVQDFCELVTEYSAWRAQLQNLLLSEEAAVPEFGSPIRDWKPLSEALQQSPGLGITWGQIEAGQNNLWVLAGWYMGTLFMVKVITPLMTSTGEALAESAGYKIRKALGVPPRPETAEKDPAGGGEGG